MLFILRHTRVRLTLIYSSLFALVAGAAAGAFWIAFVDREYSTVDDSLRNQADVIRAVLPQSPGAEIALPAQTSRGVAISAYLFSRDGSLVAESPDAGDSSFARQRIPASGFPDRSIFLSSARPGGDQVRVLVRGVSFQGQAGGLVLERPIQELQERLLTTAFLLTGVVGGLVVVACLLAYWLSGRALRPVREMAATAREISEHDLQRRIDIALPATDELGELAGTFNEMLGRLEIGFDTLQRFTADAAHELRAPLALMRAQAEVVLRQPRTGDEYRRSHRALLDEVGRMSRTVDQLLLLARADAGELAVGNEPFDLPDLLEETVDRWRPAAAERWIRVGTSIPSDGEVRGDRDLLRRVLDNLVDNAIRYTPDGGRIELDCGPTRDAWEIRVSDSGPGVPPDDRAHIFERFYRADKVRRRGEGHAGLGLALSATIARLHGGRVWLEERPSRLGGATFIVQLPTAGMSGRVRQVKHRESTAGRA